MDLFPFEVLVGAEELVINQTQPWDFFPVSPNAAERARQACTHGG